MVAHGQYLERPTLIPVGKQVLEGLWHRGRLQPPFLLLPPCPDEGGGMDHVVIAEVAWAVTRAGHPTLRFNHRGVGASQGSRGDADHWLEDSAAALRVLMDNAPGAGPAVAALGAAARTALRLLELHPSVQGLCLIAPTGIELDQLVRVNVPLVVLTPGDDHRLPRLALSAALSGVGAQLEVLEEVDSQFRRHLPEVGKAVVRWLRLQAADPANPLS